MKYLKTFLEKQGSYNVANLKNWDNPPSSTGNTHQRGKLPGELVDEDEGEDITLPINVDITGHIGTPTKSTRTRKLSKEPKIRNT